MVSRGTQEVILDMALGVRDIPSLSQVDQRACLVAKTLTYTTYTYIYIYTDVNIYVYMYICIYVYIYTYICLYVAIYLFFELPG